MGKKLFQSMFSVYITCVLAFFIIALFTIVSSSILSNTNPFGIVSFDVHYWYEDWRALIRIFEIPWVWGKTVKKFRFFNSPNIFLEWSLHSFTPFYPELGKCEREWSFFQFTHERGSLLAHIFPKVLVDDREWTWLTFFPSSHSF